MLGTCTLCIVHVSIQALYSLDLVDVDGRGSPVSVLKYHVLFIDIHVHVGVTCFCVEIPCTH